MLKISRIFLILTTCFMAAIQAGNRNSYSESTSTAYAEADAYTICPPNEHYAICKSLCPPRTCESLDRAYICLPDDQCIPGCQCDAGYYRNALGKCVTEDECRKCPRPNEGWDDCPDCSPQTCDSRYDIYYCPPVCIPSCRCEDGYYRNQNGFCIPECECDICPPGEVYSECPTASCAPQTCAEAGYDIPNCGSSDPCIGESGCVCKQGYLRNSRGKCIPSNRCPSCGGDRNAIPGCGNHCGKTCADIGRNTTIMCPQYCLVNGCDCRKGYVWDSDKKKCVKLKDCTKPKCKKNEKWVDCPDALCIPLKCSDLGYPLACPSILPGEKCPGNPGCVCADYDYVKDSKGNCIPKKQCPSCGGDPNAESGCGYHCGPQCGIKSDNSSHPMPCPCVPNGCMCKQNYIYDPKQSKCVLPEHCTNTSTSTNTTTPGACSVETVLQLLQDGIAAFTGKFLYESYQKTPDSNQIMSPMSVFWPMAKLALQANGPTYTQLIKVLNLRSKDDIRCVFPALTRKLTSDPEVVLALADRLYFSIQYPFNPNFVNEMFFIFGARPESLNFRNATAASARINEWVSNQTRGEIKEIAKPQMFTEDTRLVLANAIYFLGNWLHQFNPNKTANRPFYTSSTSSVQIPTMSIEDYFNYAEVPNLDCKILQMYYEGENFSLVILLPNRVDGLPSLIAKLQSPSVFYTVYNSTKYQKVQVYLPKFKTGSEYNLIDIMKKAGIYDLFDPDKSDLTGILLQYEPLFVSTAIHKATCEVNEIGTKAAAANIVTAAGSGVPSKPSTFDANHGFTYYILHNRNLMFCGTFVKPN